MKNVLLVDTNFSSAPIYTILSRKGYNVYVAGNNDNDYLATSLDNYIKTDYSNLNALSQVINDYKIDYIVPGCNDLSYLACAFLNEDKKFLGIDNLENTKTLLDKACFRNFALRHNLPVPQVYKLEQFKIFKDKPIVVKPVDSFSGKGITIIKEASVPYLMQAIETAKQFSKSCQYIIEDFIEGDLYSHSAFICKGKIKQDFIVAEFGSVNPLVVDTSYVDIYFSTNLLHDIRESVQTIVDELCLCDGLIHTQFIRKGDFYWLIEITRRCPGDLYSLLIEKSTGFQYSRQYLAPFVGMEDIEFNEPLKKYNIMRHTISQKSCCVFISVSFCDSICVKQYFQTAKCGDLIKPSPDGRVGLVFIDTGSFSSLVSTVNLTLQRKLYTLDTLVPTSIHPSASSKK